jgi:hypothetical protein
MVADAYLNVRAHSVVARSHTDKKVFAVLLPLPRRQRYHDLRFLLSALVPCLRAPPQSQLHHLCLSHVLALAPRPECSAICGEWISAWHDSWTDTHKATLAADGKPLVGMNEYFINTLRASALTFLSFSARPITIIVFALDTLLVGQHMGSSLYENLVHYLRRDIVDLLIIPFNFPDQDNGKYMTAFRKKVKGILKRIMEYVALSIYALHAD